MADKSDMVSSGSWRDHFKIDEKILKAFWEDFSQSSPLRASEMNLATADGSIEFVLWCIREGHFTEEAFTRYQSELFNLPIIRQEFFMAPIDTHFWERVKDLHPWNAHCLPLTEWDGHILVGSVFPNETFKSSLRHRLALATPTMLRDFHKRLETKDIKTVASPTPANVSKPTAVPVMAPEAASTTAKPATDLNDPFAALSRQFGIETETPPTDEGVTDGHEESSSSSEAPEGFVMPEGLSFGKDELSRLTGHGSNPFVAGLPTDAETSESSAAPEGFAIPNAKTEMPSFTPPNSGDAETSREPGTVVHNFETGQGEVIAKPAAPSMSLPPLAKTEKPAPPVAPSMPKAEKLPPSPPPLKKSEPIEAKAEETPLSLEDTQPDAVVAKPKAPTPPKPSMPFAPSSMPFAPQTTPGKPAVAAAPPPPPPKKEIPEAPLELEKNEPVRPVAEATVVVKADETVVINTDALSTAKPVRKPLFEPASGAKAGSTAPANAPGMTNTAGPAGGNTATGTATRARRLESTPVTSFFGMGGNPMPGAGGSPRTNPRGLSRSPELYMGRAVAVSKLEPIHLDQCRSVDEAGAQALLQACNIYETAMILLFKDGELMPWKWNDLFLSVKGDKPDAVDLSEPSIFKVVFRTAKPYHGYVVTSTINQKFFNEFYRGVLPKHATVIPIMIDGRMGGMMLGFTNSKIDYRQSLRLMERLSFDMSRVFKSLRGTMSKAG